MRDPARIDPLIEELRALWRKGQNHQMRLGQLVWNVVGDGLDQAAFARRLWNIEDGELLELVRAVLDGGWPQWRDKEGPPPPQADEDAGPTARPARPQFRSKLKQQGPSRSRRGRR